MYEHFGHTADLGLRVEATDLNALFADAAKGLLAMVVENPDAVEPRQTVQIEIAGAELDYQFFDWLNEILYRIEAEHLLLSQFEIQVGDAGVQAVARGETLDRARHRVAHEVKAITYHHLKVEQTATGWRAEVIVDI